MSMKEYLDEYLENQDVYDDEQEETHEEQETTENETTEKSGNAITNAGKDVAKKKIEKAAAKNAGKMALKGALSHFLIYAAIVIACIIIIIGIIMFLVTMPGMVMEKLKGIFKAVGNYVAAFFGADTTEQIEDTEVFETLDYLEDMGWDIKGEGFLSDYSTEADIADLEDADSENGYVLDEKTGVIRNEDGNIVGAKSDFIFAYIMSDNYIYTLKNDNVVTQSDKDGGFWGTIKNIFSGVATAAWKIYKFVYGPAMDFLGVNNAVMETWGKGMLAIYTEDGSLGVSGNMMDVSADLLDWSTIKVDTKSKKLIIKRRTNIFNNNNALEFNLDGWTGRYGMPLEFLLAVHKATLMPDLATDMVNSFPTEIKIILHKTSDGSQAEAGYKAVDGTYITYKKIENEIHSMESDGIISSIVNWIDDWFTTDGEVEAARRLGVDVGPGYCTEGDECTTTMMAATGNGYAIRFETHLFAADEWVYAQNVYGDPEDTSKITIPIGTHFADANYEPTNYVEVIETACERCRKVVDGIEKYMGDNNDYNFEAYIPYINKVSNHWYRDVHFVADVSDTTENFVQYDYDYEALVKERWTLYETYIDDDSSDYRYNPDRAGEFILYRIDENGEYLKDSNGSYVLFEGTVEDARPTTLYEKDGEGYKEYEGSRLNLDGKEVYFKRSGVSEEYVKYTGDVAVAKKAVEMELTSDNLEDLGWNKSTGSIWSAYKTENTTSGFEPLFDAEEISAEEDPIYQEVMENCYINLKINSNVVQTGEGIRKETNPKIKKMFLQNNYFQYDGSTDKAEIITALRNEVYSQTREADKKSKYGALTDEELEISTVIDGKTYTVKDYAGKVTLNQDSLNAFTMLENTHTLDADYIYRDFKELIVELAYFEKEELTESIPKLLQFPIPEIGSYGYPIRSLDKRENEFGTMLHSKRDYEVNEDYTLQAIVANATNAGAAEESDEDDQALITIENENSNLNESVTLATTRVNNNRLQLSSRVYLNTIEVGDIEGATKKPQQVQLKDFLDAAEEMCAFIDEKGYDYCVNRPTNACTTCSETCKANWSTNLKCMKEPSCECSEVHCNHAVHKNNCDPAVDGWILPGNFESSQSGTKMHNTCCNYLASWALQNVGLIENVLSISDMYTWALEVGGKEIANGQPLEPGDILIYDDFGHVDIVAEKNGGSYLKFNGGHYIDTGSERGTSQSSINEFAGWAGRAIQYAIRLPWGGNEDGVFEGYYGNEAVVSPVTGILLEYGTYDEEDIDSITEEEYRVNVDLKYGPANKVATEGEETEGETPEEEQEGEIVSDKVGYAKILVLDKENFEKLESKVTNNWSSNNNGQGLLSDKGIFDDLITTEEQYEDLTDESSNSENKIAKNVTVYGYKEFVEQYEMGGIAGNIIYIDGFKCELPDSDFVNVDEDGEPNLTDKPDGEDLTIDSFKITQGKLHEENEKVINMYEADDEYKVASAKATEKLNVESMLKIDAKPAVSIKDPETNEDLIFIKEGTVLGRTYTDKELVEDLRGESLDDYKEPPEDKKNASDEGEEEEQELGDLIGNYLRIIMRDLDDTVVENVEDYMKLDEMVSGDQEYQFREGDLEILADAIHHEGCGSYCASLFNTTSEDDKLYLATSVGYTIINKLNTDSGFSPDYNDSSNLWDSSQSPLYNLLCRIPSGSKYQEQAAQYGFTTGLTGGWYAIAPGLRHRIEINELEYCDICFEAAEYIKDNDSMNFTCNGKFGAEFAAGEGMPHTMWEQGAGYYDNHKIWLYVDKNKNGIKDTECVDSGDFYLFDTDN